MTDIEYIRIFDNVNPSMFYRSKVHDNAYLYVFGIAESEYEVRIPTFNMADP